MKTKENGYQETFKGNYKGCYNDHSSNLNLISVTFSLKMLIYTITGMSWFGNDILYNLKSDKFRN